MPAPLDPAAEQVRAEQRHLDAAYALLDRQRDEARADLTAVLRRGADGATDVHVREATAAGLTRRLARLDGAEHALCFGRVDLADGEVRHVGRLGLRADDRDEPLLVDWRADAARPFYAATPVHPMGVRRRRHLDVTGRRVRRVSDEVLDGSAHRPGDVVGDDPLTEALEATRTGRMGQAVATLQAEQDAVVRSDDRGVTVVQGGPGTGKTVVALHRAAYVLYAFPRAAEDGVLVLGPDSVFLDYISQVLPSLGENDVVLATADDLTGRSATAAEPLATARLKGTAVLADAVAALVRRHQAPGTPRFAVRVGGEEVVLDARTVAEGRARAAGSGLPHNAAREVLHEHLVDALTDALERRAVDDLARIDAEVSAATGMDLDRAAAADLRSLGYDDGPAHDLSAEFDADAVREELAGDPLVDGAVTALWPRLRPEDLVRRLLSDAALLAACAPRLTADDRALLLRPADAPWTRADLPLLDEAEALLDGPPERVFGHVVVDEAQELTHLQWRMVVRRCPSRSMTVVGDFAQAGPLTTARTWAEALGAHVSARLAVTTLTVSYRTTQEILASTRELLARIAPDQTPSRSVRHGEQPRRLTTTRDALLATVTGELRAQAAAHPDELRAVISTEEVLAVLADAVAPWARLVPASRARGLEFDTVLVVDPDGIAADRPGGDRDVYVAVTRPTRRLCTVEVTQG
ncbi:HelD family protein [Cellulomonas endometrii]|uniref:HelD family protein n=1 Tax=Cellulomonas endometrii TaxID=3036301 RepID=UPI0024AD1B67|nr:helicase [Cellulomonas endometrii]